MNISSYSADEITKKGGNRSLELNILTLVIVCIQSQAVIISEMVKFLEFEATRKLVLWAYHGLVSLYTLSLSIYTFD